MSRASEWYTAQMRVQQSFMVSGGVAATVRVIPNDGPVLDITTERVTVSATPEQAIAFAKWLLATFSDETVEGPEVGKKP